MLRCAWAISLLACQSPPSRERCLQPDAREGTAVARVGEHPITVDEITERIRQQGTAAMKRYGDPKKLHKFVEDQVRFELLAQAALERGLDRDPDVMEAARKVMVRKLLLRDMGSDGFAAVSEKAIRRYYEQHTEEYVQPEKRRIAEIRLAPTEQGRALASSIVAQLQARPNERNLFRQLQMKHSLKKQVRVIGLSDLFKTRERYTKEYGPHFTAVVFAMKPDTIAPEPAQSTRGWHVVRVLAVRDPLARGFDEVREEITERLRRGERSKAFDTYLGEIKRRYPVAIYETQLPKILLSLGRSDKKPDHPKGGSK